MESHFKKLSTMKFAKKMSIFRGYLRFILMCFMIPLMPLLTFISFILWQLALVLSRFYPEYGKFIACYDAWMDEKFDGFISRSSIVITLTIDGDLTLDKLQRIFTENVLDARILTDGNTDRQRYPELKQYLTTFMGFRIWKNDPNFNIENHVSEKFDLNLTENDELDLLTTVHPEMLNTPYPRDRSPWDIVLIRNIKGSNNNSDSSQKSVVAIRVHHVMSDARSILKLIIECLGRKQLKTAKPSPVRGSLAEWTLHYLMFPFNYLTAGYHTMNMGIQSHLHPWKNHSPRIEEGCIPWVVGLSPKMSMSDIKQVAKKHGMNPSAVVSAMITGGIREYGHELENQDVAVGFTMPMSNHPKTLTNNFYYGSMMLPTSEPSMLKRLRKCQEAFTKVKTTGFVKHMHIQGMQAGMMPCVLAQYTARNYFYPVCFTNIAGEEEGFLLEDLTCSDVVMSAAALPGCSGLEICIFSYKGSVRVSATAKENMMSKAEVGTLANKFSAELKYFLNH